MRVVVAEDNPVFRRGLVELLEDNGFQVVAEAASKGELLAVAARTDPDVVIVDIRMPPTDTTEGLDAARQLKETNPSLGVLVLSAYVVPEYAERLAAHSDGIGYLLKDHVASVSVLTDAVQRVALGDVVIDPGVVDQLMGRPRTDSVLARLTAGEQAVLRLMAEGRSNARIAELLTVTVKAVEAHIGNIFRKLELSPQSHRRVHAVLTFLREQPAMPPLR